jgi:hypothetical protein
VADGSIQCNDWTATTTDAHLSGRPVRCPQPSTYSIGSAVAEASAEAAAWARMSSLGSMPMTFPAHPPHQRDDNPVPEPRSTTKAGRCSAAYAHSTFANAIGGLGRARS